MPTATQPPPASAPTIAAKAPRPGPSAISVNMPTPPSTPTTPTEAPKADVLDFGKYARPADEALVTPSTTPRKPAVETPASDEKPKTEQPPETTEADEPKETPETPEPEVDDDLEDGAPKPEAKPEEKPGEKGKKISPWKLVEEHKAARLKAEAEIVELRKLVPNEAEAKANSEKITAAEKRVQELENHLRLVDYQNHPEFKQKYEQPYVDKWQSIMKRLDRVQVKDAEGNPRAVQPGDIARLGSLPADQTIEQAEAQFGKLGNWVAERVEELKALDESKAAALENARKDAATLHETLTGRQKEISGFLEKTWTQAVDQAAKHSKYGKYFQPVKGDAEFNSKLEAGLKKVDEVLSSDPRNPNLTPEQREQMVRRTAAVRNRAAAFGVLTLTVNRLESKVAELQAQLAEYESSTPKTEGKQAADPNAATPPSGYTMDSFGQALEKRSRPGVVG